MTDVSPKRNETDPSQPHHFQLRGHIIRSGHGRGMHYNTECAMEGCGKYVEDLIHDYEDPLIAEAQRKMEEQKHRMSTDVNQTA